MSFVADPARGDGTNGRSRQQPARQLENLALAVLGRFALKDDGTRLSEPGGMTKGGAPDDFGQQPDLGRCVFVAAKDAVEQTGKQ